jgi:hypothetical protein
VAEHSIESSDQINFKDTEVLAKTAGYVDQLVKEGIEIWLYSNNINQERGFKLSQAWNLTINILQSIDTDSFNIRLGSQKEEKKNNMGKD